MDPQTREEAILRFQIKRSTINLYKRFLEILERLKDEHDENHEKLRANLPAQYKNYVDLAEYFTDIKSESLRKEVLGLGNDTVRALENELNNFDIVAKH